MRWESNGRNRTGVKRPQGQDVASQVKGVFITVAEVAEVAEGAASGEPNAVAMTIYILCVGIMTAWIYAAIRPRFGPGPGTAFKASTAAWLIWSVFGFTMTYWLGILSGSEVMFGTIAAFIYMNAGGYVAAMMYQEEGSGSGASTSSAPATNEYVKN